MFHTEMAPVVIDRENKLATASTCLWAMRGDKLYVENCEGEEEHFV